MITKHTLKKNIFLIVCLYFVVVNRDTYVGRDIMNLFRVTIIDQFRGNGGWWHNVFPIKRKAY